MAVGVNVAQPLFLLLIPLVLAPVILWGIKTIKNRFNRGLFTTIRCVVVVLVVLAMAGVSIMHTAGETTHIAVMDLSASMEGTLPSALDFLQQAEGGRTAQDNLGIVCFGENAVVDMLPGQNVPPDSITSQVKKGFTNLAEGLRLAQSVLPQNTKKQVVVFSDGQENMDDAVTQAKLLAGQGVTISVVPLSGTVTEEVQLSSIKVPKTLKKDSAYAIEVSGYALTATEGRLLVYKNNTLIIDETVSLHKGENKLVFSDVAEESGGVIYRAELLPQADTFSQNNKVFGYSSVEGAPSLLVVSDNGSGDAIADILESARVDVNLVGPQAVPTALEQLSRYDGVILANIDIDTMPESLPPLLESYVKDAGGGLLATGGAHAFGPGGYKDTPLETLLPVNMEMKDNQEMPDMGMLIVLDRSGSMGMGMYGVSKLELAKEAVIRSLDALADQDSLGVIAFDDGFEWASPLMPVGGNRGTMETNVANISLGGGTSILPGLREAYETIAEADVKIKHIILLTDGQAEQTGYDGLIQQMNASGVTLSTVAVGSDSDIKLLKSLAEEANGRYYYSDEFTDLPKIFAKETQMAGKSFLNNELFYPMSVDPNPILQDIESLPPLEGYVSTTIKNRADMVLASPKNEPVLAAWPLGLGRTVAFTSDMEGMWSGQWLASNEGVQTFKNMVSWIVRRQMASDVMLTAALEGENTILTAAIPYGEDVLGMKATVLAPDLSRIELPMERVAPGEFKGMLPQREAGAYMATLEVQRENGAEMLSTGVSIPYSPEYDVRQFDKGRSLLKRLAEASGGRVLEDPAQLYGGGGLALQEVSSKFALDNVLLILALCLFVLDVALRRFPVLSNRLERGFARMKSWFKAQPFGRKNSKAQAQAQAKPKPETAEGETKAQQPKQTRLKAKAKTKDKEKEAAMAKAKAKAADTSSALVSRKKKRSGPGQS